MPSSDQPVDHPSAVSRNLWILLALALVLTLVNAVKPLHMDDPFIYRVAEQIAADPTNPYGFDIFWLQWPQPVSEELTPPVVPYWWSIGLKLFGERPALWKLWLFPFAAMLCLGLHALVRRFAPSLALPLVAATVLSPAILPGFNLMQDIPALALGVATLEVYFRAAERGRIPWMVAAGLLGGLATQTKYTMVGVLGAIALDGLLSRRLRPAVATLSIALAVFFGWELLMTASYGQGMFFGQLRYGLFWYPRLEMILPLLRLLGATAPLIWIWVLAGLGVPRRVTTALSVVVFAAFGLLFWLPVERGLFLILGSFTVAALAAALASIWGSRVAESSATDSPAFGLARPELFLLGWLVIEIGVYFAASPFPAVRRVLGVILVATLIAGCVASRRVAQTNTSESTRSTALPVWALILASALLGVGFQIVDIAEAQAQKNAPKAAAALIAAHIDPASAKTESDLFATPTTWYVGHWGFQYYAERLGMQPVVPDVSQLKAGDWLVVPRQVHQQEIRLDPSEVRLIQTLEAGRRLPLSTGHGYYGESVPLSHLAGSRLSTDVFRLTGNVIPATAWPPAQLADWAQKAGGLTAAAALPALRRTLGSGNDRARQHAAEGLEALGARATDAVPELIEALKANTPELRYSAAKALAAVGPGAEAATRPLEALRQDPDPEVREAAETALIAIRQGEQGG